MGEALDLMALRTGQAGELQRGHSGSYLLNAPFMIVSKSV